MFVDSLKVKTALALFQPVALRPGKKCGHKLPTVEMLFRALQQTHCGGQPLEQRARMFFRLQRIERLEEPSHGVAWLEGP